LSEFTVVNERPLHVLLVEDEEAVRRAFARALTIDGFSVDETDTAESALDLASRVAYDIIVLDMSLPSHDGVWFIESLRTSGVETPIMVSSGRGADTDVEGALDAGADEYVIKPVSAPTLSARVRALARRAARSAKRTSVGDLQLHAESHTASGSLGSTSLTAKEFALLSLFVEQPRRLLSRDDLLQSVWGYSFDPETSVVDVAMHRLRQKLAKVTDQLAIESRRGAGFQLVPTNLPAPPVAQER
jgi:DNA-binding response OmpR family regulator